MVPTQFVPIVQVWNLSLIKYVKGQRPKKPKTPSKKTLNHEGIPKFLESSRAIILSLVVSTHKILCLLEHGSVPLMLIHLEKICKW
jgi:hypothetical protein